MDIAFEADAFFFGVCLFDGDASDRFENSASFCHGVITSKASLFEALRVDIARRGLLKLRRARDRRLRDCWACL